MCGIFCCIKCTKNNENTVKTLEWSQCKDVIAARGPDTLNELNEQLTDQWHGQFCASVLWMQGSAPVSQPLVDNDCNILLWNGDVFAGSLYNAEKCDSQEILSALRTSSDISNTLSNIKGPFSFIYYQKSSNLLYFARDKFGRHSLLIKLNGSCDSLVLTSTAVKNIQNVLELPAIGLFIVDLNTEVLQLKCIPWYEPNERLCNIIKNFENRLNRNISIVNNSNYLPKIERLDINMVPDNTMGFLKYIGSIPEHQSFDEIMDFFFKQENINKTIDDLLKLLSESVKRRVKIIPNFCKYCTILSYKKDSICQHAKVGLLFSGGLDSAILAAIAHNYVDINESIDLINVAFEKKNNSNYEVPDRITGKQTYNELLNICPNRKFNFIEVDISSQELEKYRSLRVSNLVYPQSTVLDDSLACAVWFASRGKGILNPTKQQYESTCRVLLLGMGADEQFGGYMRHRTILKREGWIALTKELKLEFNRISERNLGRDDRMVADHGRQSRLPYLDEDFVDFVQQLSPWERCCPIEKFPSGLGDKLLLRLLARKIKLHGAAKFPKRAFQFGSRIANGKENAKDLSTRL